MTWTGSVSTDWNNPTNWTPQQVPIASDHVTINSGSSSIIPAGGAFAIMDWNGGSIYGALTLASNGVLNVSGSADKNLYGPLTNAGTIVWTGAGNLQAYNYSVPPYSGEIYNLAGGLFDIQNDTVVGSSGYAALFSNAGTVRKATP
jgi:hypothetical protein